MAQEIEIEFKNLLTKDEFDRLLLSLPFPAEPQTQTNHYFETTKFELKENGAALRIRKKNGTYTLTLKQPHEKGLLETHDTLTDAETEKWLNGQPVIKQHVSEQLAALNIDIEELIYFGSLTTERRELEYGDSLLVLDYSMYGNTSDYELELEAASIETGRQMIDQILHTYHIQKRKTPNKIKRFFMEKMDR
ncbi:CYTH domain-containing protein [Virgibacillus siamensis]|uniref:CYTH domain-containing protein n=1 Tax=Virgibacillus siamensis TaxID=480071 RepID=UPI000986DFE2|nr:CYTH domain-containing protein [Virgibacillus siamensis]